MRALLISENAPVPSDRRVWNEARALRDAGWDVTVICAMGETRHREPYELVDGIAIHRFALKPAEGGLLGYAREYAQALWRIRRLARRLARERPFDVVHAGNPPDFLLLAVRSLRRQGKGTRFVFDHHDLVPELYASKFGGDGGLMYKVACAQERVAYRLADAVIVTNGSYRAIALGRHAKIEPLFEVFNLFNRRNDLARVTVFGTGAYPTTPAANFGQVTVVGDPRSVQLGARVIF